MKEKNLVGMKTPHVSYFAPACFRGSVCRTLLPAACTLALLFLLATTAHCREIPWSGRNFVHISEEQPVKAFLKDLFLSEEILANISASIKDTPMSGKFDMPPAQAFKRITTAFNLIWYYDGQVVYIYPAGEIESKTIGIKHASVKKVKRSLKKMGITDRKYPLRYYTKERIVMVQGPKIYVERVSNAVATIDVYRKGTVVKAPAKPAPDPPAQPVQHMRIFRLKHAWAADRQLQIGDRTVTIEGVATILKGLTKKEGHSTPGQPSSAGARPVTARPAKAKKTENRNTQPGGKEKKPSTTDVDYLPENRHTIQCAERLNAVIVNADPVNMAYYEKMIAELDVPLQLIEIKASIIDVDSEALSAIGLDFEGSRNQSDGAHTYQTNLIPDSHPLFDLAKIPAGSFGGLGFSAILGDLADDYFAVRLKALESKGKAKIVSKPSIITFDNIEARFTNTETFYVRVAAQEDASLYEISAGIVLKVTPHLIFDDHSPKIQLFISIEDGKIKGNVVDQIPVVENSTINTQAVVGGNESLLIGGLIYDQHTEVQRKVPLMGDIPLLGYLFRSKDRVSRKTERLFLISPRILNVDGNASVVVQHDESRRPGRSYRNWPPIKLFETTF